MRLKTESEFLCTYTVWSEFLKKQSSTVWFSCCHFCQKVISQAVTTLSKCLQRKVHEVRQNLPFGCLALVDVVIVVVVVVIVVVVFAAAAAV